MEHGTVTGYDHHGCKCDECKSAKAEAQSKQRRKKQAVIDEIKSVSCLDCGGVFPPECMDFDHVTGEKEFPISFGVKSVSMQRVLDEIAKCEIICSNCHRIRTVERSRSG